MMKTRQFVVSLAASFMTLFALAPCSHADSLNLVDVFFNAAYSQTASGVNPAAFNYFFNGGAQTANTAPVFTSVSLSDPGPGSPYNLTNEGGGVWFYSASFSSASDMNTAHPTGTYTFNANPGGTSAAFNYTTQAFTSTLPALTNGSYSGLQGLNASNPYTVNFNSFTPNVNADLSFTFFTVFLASDESVVWTDGFLPPSTTSVTIPGGTLQPGTAYFFELNFDNRITGSTGVPFQQGFDQRTDGNFKTAGATPEPSSLLLLGIGLLGVLTSAAWTKRHPPPISC